MAPRQCICTSCHCGRHRCPHNRFEPNRVVTKTEPLNDCLMTEYGGNFKTSETQLGPRTRPKDNLGNEGTVDYTTESKEKFKNMELNTQIVKKEYDAYSPPKEKMELISEYNNKFIKDGVTRRASQLSYLKSTTQDLPNGRIDDMTIQKQDFKPWSASKAAIKQRNPTKQEYEPPTGAFTGASSQRTDYARHNTVAPLRNKMPDTFNFGNEPIDNNTVNRLAYRPHQVEQLKPIHKVENYVPPSSPFTNQSLSKTDFQGHRTSKAELHKPQSTIFQTTSPFQTQTTHGTEFQRWSSSAPTSMKPQQMPYSKPTVPMEGQSTSKDYGYYNNGKRADNARPKSQIGRNGSASFANSTNYSTQYPRHDVQPLKRVKAAQERHTNPNQGHFDGTSEQRDNFHWHSGQAPERQRPIDKLAYDGKIDSLTQYNKDFPSHSAKECLGEALLKGKIDGVTYHDDPDTGHRYVVMPPLRSAPIR